MRFGSRAALLVRPSVLFLTILTIEANKKLIKRRIGKPIGTDQNTNVETDQNLVLLCAILLLHVDALLQLHDVLLKIAMRCRQRGLFCFPG